MAENMKMSAAGNAPQIAQVGQSGAADALSQIDPAILAEAFKILAQQSEGEKAPTQEAQSAEDPIAKLLQIVAQLEAAKTAQTQTAATPKSASSGKEKTPAVLG
jgi:hypothetical protein